jgi:hypothetical protein
MPIQKTKFVISHAQPTVLFNPHIPIPFHNTIATQYNPYPSRANETAIAKYHDLAGGFSTWREIS